MPPSRLRGPRVRASPRPAFFALLAAALLLLACIGSAVAATQTKQQALTPGASVELDVQLGSGQRSPWRVTVTPAGVEVWLNVHTHTEDGRVEDFVNQPVNGSAEGTFEAPRFGVYSWWVIANRSAEPAQVVVEAEGSLPGEDTGSEGSRIPGAGAAETLLMALTAAGLAFRRRRHRPT